MSEDSKPSFLKQTQQLLHTVIDFFKNTPDSIEEDKEESENDSQQTSKNSTEKNEISKNDEISFLESSENFFKSNAEKLKLLTSDLYQSGSSFLGDQFLQQLPSSENSFYSTNVNLPTRAIGSGAGLIYMPTARFFPEGYMFYDTNRSGPYQQFRLSFTPFSWAEASLFYNDINTLRYGIQARKNQSYKDKGFAFRVKAKDQGYFPALVLGMEDFAGTGLYSGEYITSSYSYKDFDFTLGYGWGKYGSRSNVKNIFTYVDDSFRYRVENVGSTGGKLSTSAWFSGPASLFGGVEYLISQKHNITLKAEYSSNDFNEEVTYSPAVDWKYPERYGSPNRKYEKSRYNFGISWRPTKNIQTSLFFTRGNEISWQFSLLGDVSRVSRPLGLTKNIGDRREISPRSQFYLDILNFFNSRGILIQNLHLEDANSTLVVKYIQSLKNEELDVILEMETYLRAKYPELSEIVFIPKLGPFDYASVSTNKNNNIFISGNKYPYTSFNPKVIYPFVEWSLAPGYKLHLGSPAGFVLGELNLTASTTLVYNPNLEFDMRYIFPLLNNYEDLYYFSDPSDNLYPLRVNIQDYLREGTIGPEITQVSYMTGFNDHYFLGLAGDLELMLGGVHLEYLYRKTEWPISFGLDFTHAKERKPKKSFFSYGRYNTNTFNGNLYYYNEKTRLQFYLSIGRYLAKDEGYTFEVSRKFRNGFTVGGFFTRTDLSFEEFGEGSFDKGIFFSLPINLFSSKNHRGGSFGEGYRPVTRDGGSKVYVTKRLYSLTTLKSRYSFY